MWYDFVEVKPQAPTLYLRNEMVAQRESFQDRNSINSENEPMLHIFLEV